MTVHDRSILERAGVKVTPTSLVISDPELPYEDFEHLCAFLGEVEKSCSWWVGDAVLAGEGLYGQKVAQAAELTGLAPQTIANRVSICSRIPRSRRRGNVHFSLHAEIAYFEAKEQKEWLDKISDNGWTRSVLRENLAPVRAKKELERRGGVEVSTPNGSVEVLPPEVVESHICKCVVCGRAHRDDIDVEE